MLLCLGNATIIIMGILFLRAEFFVPWRVESLGASNFATNMCMQAREASSKFEEIKFEE